MFCFFQAEDGIRDLVRSRGLGDVYKRQALRAGPQSRRRRRGGRGAGCARSERSAHPTPVGLSLIHI